MPSRRFTPLGRPLPPEPEVIEFFVALRRPLALPHGASLLFDLGDARRVQKPELQRRPPWPLLAVSRAEEIGLRVFQLARRDPRLDTLTAVGDVVESVTGLAPSPEAHSAD